MNGHKVKALRREMVKAMNNPPQSNLQNIVQAIVADPQAYQNIRCECGGAVFDRASVIKVIPGTHPMNPTGRPQNLTLETFVCKQCGALMDPRLIAGCE